MHIAIRISSVRMRACALWLLAGAACVPVFAADTRTPPDVTARYQRERATCDSGKSAEDRATCLREAAAARDAAAHGELEDRSDYERNALARCDAVPPADRDACRHRALGEGEMKGSVSGGGIIREYREITLPPTTPEKLQRPPSEQKHDDGQGR